MTRKSHSHTQSLQSCPHRWFFMRPGIESDYKRDSVAPNHDACNHILIALR